MALEIKYAKTLHGRKLSNLESKLIDDTGLSLRRLLVY